MKNSLFSIFLFIILLGFLTYKDISFKNLCSEVIDMCEEMETTMKSSSKEENFKNAMDIYDLIQGNQLNGTDRVLGRCKEKEFEIIETKDIIVTTHIRDNGSDVDRQPYNKDDESTAIQVSKETLIDYVVKVENNYERPAEDFEVYIPIPKK